MQSGEENELSVLYEIVLEDSGADLHVINVAPLKLCYPTAQTLLGYLPASSWSLLGRNIEFSNIQDNSSKCMQSGQIKNIYNRKKLTYIAMD